MISITKQSRQATNAQQHEHFLKMLPRIRRQAGLAFRRLRPEPKRELIQEVIANAYLAFARLVRRGREGLAFATPLANFAIRQALAGRRVGNKQNCRDLSSVLAQRRRGFSLRTLPSDCSESNIWSEVLADDTLTPVADQVAFRMDFPVWLRIQNRRNRELAKFLAVGNTATEAAKRFCVSIPRISQLRRELQASWQEFQGGTPWEPSGRHGDQRAGKMHA
jgi:hypothetical protein